MPSSKQIKTQIASIKNTKKITGAMELVAASKMKRSQLKATHSRPYADAIHDFLWRSAHIDLLAESVYVDAQRAENGKRHAYILVTTDRGLCGGLNVNLFKHFVQHLQHTKQTNDAITTCVFGKKGAAFLRRMDIDVQLTAPIKDEVNFTSIVAMNKLVLDGYVDGDLDVVHVVYNHFVNNMTYKPTIKQLLPLVIDEQRDNTHDYIYDTSTEALLDMMVSRYLESLLQGATLENIACEQASRMIAMKSATDNAQSLTDQLHLVFNKSRQAAITQEISEIVAGAM